MRILFVNPGGDASGGAERSLALLIKALCHHDHEVGVITLIPGNATEAMRSAGATPLANGIGDGLGTVRRHGSALTFIRGATQALGPTLRVAAEIRALGRRFGADLIHTNGLRAHLLTPMLSRSFPVVWSLRERPPGELARRTTRGAARMAAAITAPSSFAASLVLGCRRPVYIIPNPVETPILPNREAARAALGLPAGRQVVAVAAHLHPTKGHHVAVDAWRHLRLPRPMLVLAGGDLYGEVSSTYRSSLHDKIHESGLEDDIVLPGVIADVSQLYAAADVVVHPALHPEGFGRSTAEAQACGVPIIATALGATPELIEHGVSGLLIQPGDPAGLADAIASVLDDPALAGQLRAGGTESLNRYSPDAHAAAMEAVYRMITA